MQQTRGIGIAEYDDSGLFAPALGFEGRFSIFSITGHRTADGLVAGAADPRQRGTLAEGD